MVWEGFYTPTVSRLRAGLFTLALAWLGAPVARAHDPGLSSLHLTARDGAVEITLQFAPADAAHLAPLDADGDGRVTRAEFETARPGLDAIAGQWLALRQGEQPLALRPMSTGFEEEGDNIAFRAIVPAPASGEWMLFFPRLIALPPGHRQSVTVSLADGRAFATRLVEADQPWLAVTWPASSPVAKPQDEPRPSAQGESGPDVSRAVFVPFLKLGIEHILIGYDHLLFLAGLLLACRRFGEMVVIITSFTLAHSLSLALATFDLVSLPGRLVEPLIAASILYVGIENIWKRNDVNRFRWLLTFAFGLVHGLGFASVLRDLGIGEAGRGALWPLLGFNAGVEIGQLAVAAILLPILLYARRAPKFEQRGLPILSGIVAAAGLFWLVERLV
jgi:hydrogenase/urease accessory protein HupE